MDDFFRCFFCCDLGFFLCVFEVIDRVFGSVYGYLFDVMVLDFSVVRGRDGCFLFYFFMFFSF